MRTSLCGINNVPLPHIRRGRSVVNLVDLARAFTPEGDELTLRQRDEEFEIRFKGWEVMSNRGSLSEESLARLVCEGLGRRPARLLIGGLGMGYTVRAALDAASPDFARYCLGARPGSDRLEPGTASQPSSSSP